MALTDKKRRFADALMSGATNREAAIAAGYSEKTASQAGYGLSKDPDVLQHIERKKALADAKQEARAEGKTLSLKSLSSQFDDPKEFLASLMNDLGEETKIRFEAAKALMPYVHGKVAEQGKKDAKAQAAKEASKGRFSASTPPKLVVNNR
ncbi:MULTISPECIES: terminase small subunit [Pseudomonas]|uniref:Terminase small subunit n=1 Tax=Pseudomonas luteola TaxID=47886 RepID=A0ABS0FPN3_PSELU|nr:MULTISPECIES: terminase small subunit [Pseudomonas]MBF8642269.1 terminase small subunit [Pseudomonas zeshuii]RRW48346.1 terminase small subunit [Pseudomonas luteola]SHJ24459.1 phage terminase small subunit [Pseudomonas zeshuii]